MRWHQLSLLSSRLRRTSCSTHHARKGWIFPAKIFLSCQEIIFSKTSEKWSPILKDIQYNWQIVFKPKCSPTRPLFNMFTYFELSRMYWNKKRLKGDAHDTLIYSTAYPVSVKSRKPDKCSIFHPSILLNLCVDKPSCLSSFVRVILSSKHHKISDEVHSGIFFVGTYFHLLVWIPFGTTWNTLQGYYSE